MPTDRSRPAWHCDVCGSGYGPDRAAAERCEATPVPDPLPAGTLVLLARASGSRFDVVAVESADGPRRPDGARREHLWSYRLSGHHDPRPSSMLRPHRPAVLNVLGGLYRGPFAGYYAARTPEMALRAVVAAAERVGLILQADNVERWVSQRSPDAMACGPLPPAVRAVLEALGVAPEPFLAKRRGWWSAAGMLAREHSRGDEWGAQVWLLTTPEADIVEALDDRLRRWWAGEAVVCPAPDWRPTGYSRTARPLSQSKLNKEQRAAVAASGVVWRPRTNSSDFARACARHLEVDVNPVDTRLFPVPMVVAVAGGKGGVGKSTVAAALAGRLAAGGTPTVLFDWDLAGPSQHLVWALGDVPVDDASRRILATPVANGPAGLGVISLGQLLEPGEELGWDAATRASWVQFLAGAVDLDDVEVVVVDLPPGRSVLYDLLAAGYPTQVETWVHVTTAHPLGLDATARLLPTRADEMVVVVENLSETKVNLDGRLRRVRLVGAGGEVAAMAAASNALYGGSLPFADSAQALAQTEELGSLADLVLAHRGQRQSRQDGPAAAVNSAAAREASK